MKLDPTINIGNVIQIILIVIGGIWWIFKLTQKLDDVAKSLNAHLDEQVRFNEASEKDRMLLHRKVGRLYDLLERNTVIPIPRDVLDDEIEKQKPKKGRKVK